MDYETAIRIQLRAEQDILATESELVRTADDFAAFLMGTVKLMAEANKMGRQ